MMAVIGKVRDVPVEVERVDVVVGDLVVQDDRGVADVDVPLVLQHLGSGLGP
jgi:regulator of RNase E activity RraA